MAKPKRRKATLRSAGTVTADAILERARDLADDPTPALPQCEGGCVLFSPMASARKGILKAHAARDDEKALERLASKGNELARAYAATLLVGKGEKIPFVAELRMGGISAPYVLRGKAKPFYTAGLQNHEDRQLRLLSYTPWIKKRGLHVWSTDAGIVCTGKRPTPPRAFLDAEAEELGLHAEGDRFVCPHGGSGPDRDAIVLGFRGSPATLERCRACLDETPFLLAVARHVAAPGLTRIFDLRPSPAPLQGDAPPVDARVPEEALAAYRRGQVSDTALLDAAREARAAALRALPRRLLVAGDRVFPDEDALLAALGASPAETRALRAGLAGREKPLVVDKASPARVMVELWGERGLEMLAAAGDEATAKRLHKERVTVEDVSDLVRRAEREGARDAALAHLPRYDRLPPAAAAADHLARAYRAEGQEGAVRAALERSSSGKAKGVALAFLEVLGAAKGQEWRFAQADREVAAGLAPEIETLLRGEPARYHDALVTVSRRTGETTPFSPRG